MTKDEHRADERRDEASSMTVIEPETLKRTLSALRGLIDALPDEVLDRQRERIEFTPTNGLYERAVLNTPDGASFLVGPARLWGSGLGARQNIDVPIDAVPEHLHDSGLGDCELTVYNPQNQPILRGTLVDDGNVQAGLNTICVAVDGPDSTPTGRVGGRSDEF